MNLEQIEKDIKKLVSNVDQENFIYDFLLVYGLPKSSINRLKKGDYNKSKNDGEIIWAKKVYFKTISENEDVHDVIDDISKSDVIEKQKIRFIIVTDFKTFLSKDIKTSDTLDIETDELHKNSHFFLPLIGQEKAENVEENLADIKAADKMSKLFDLIIKDNPLNFKSGKEKHGLNIFFTRLLFCFFAEDAEVFEKGLFTRSVQSYTNASGEDVDIFFEKLFSILKGDKIDHAEYLKNFPYVNGDLFKNTYFIPKFTEESRKLIIEAGSLDWNSINPDILGSMMQAIVQQGVRHELGMHYTSVKNILKIIKPLFLDELNNELINSKNDIKKLNKLLVKIYNINIFDPACGSGNFLVISYKELYKIEIEILRQLKDLDKNDWLISKSGIELSQFFGIELDDYAHEMAKLSLWIAQHQMNNLYEEILNDKRSFLPLAPSGNIYCKNANLIEWEDICPKKSNKQIFVVGNPPYVGSSMQTKEQKVDMEHVFKGKSGFKNLDYISSWFLKGSRYIQNSDIELAFISTKSICQGEQVSMLWPIILGLNLEIGFSYDSFRWSNNAKYNAGVTCIIISLRNISKKDKFIFGESSSKKVKNINAYLIASKNIFISKRNNSISDLPKMSYGNKPVDSGNLLLNEDERNKIINEYPKTKRLIRKFYGADEFIKGKSRYCIWIENSDLELANSIPIIKKRIEKIKLFRLNSKKPATKKLAIRPHQFEDLNTSKNNCIIVPSVSSERRKYIPIGFLEKNVVVSNAAHVIYDPPLYLLSILCSYMHMKWVFAVGGYLGSSIRYSSTLCYNSFPLPFLNNQQKKDLEDLTLELVDEREKFSEKTMSELYDVNKMPKSLVNIHEKIDITVDKIYNKQGFNSDEVRLSYLFELYENLNKKNELI